MLILLVNFCFSVKQNSDWMLSINLVPWLLSGREKRLITLQYLPNGILSILYISTAYILTTDSKMMQKPETEFCLSIFFF